jgi:hypothetical protein
MYHFFLKWHKILFFYEKECGKCGEKTRRTWFANITCHDGKRHTSKLQSSRATFAIVTRVIYGRPTRRW